MYNNQPYEDLGGNTVYTPCPVDRLIDAFTILEKQLFCFPFSITPKQYTQFCLDTIKFISTSIPEEYFTQKVISLDRNVKDILIRNLEKISEKIDQENVLEPYYKILLSH